MTMPIDKTLLQKLQETVAVYAIENGIDLFELKGTVDAFYNRFLKALEPDMRNDRP